MAIRLMLSLVALTLLAAVGAAYDGYPDHPTGAGYQTQYESADGFSHPSHHDGGRDPGRDHSSHFNYYYDWLSPGYTYRYWYPTTYYYSWYPTTAYTYYYTPVTYPTYYYTPAVYDWVADPWWAVNVYGIGGTTYYYSSGSSWTYHSGFYFGGL